MMHLTPEKGTGEKAGRGRESLDHGAVLTKSWPTETPKQGFPCRGTFPGRGDLHWAELALVSPPYSVFGWGFPGRVGHTLPS